MLLQIIGLKNRVSKDTRIHKKKIIYKNNNKWYAKKYEIYKVCPVGALTQEGFEAPKINYDKCIKCGKCSSFCPKKALVL